MIRVCPACGSENGPAAIHCRTCRGKLPAPVGAAASPRPAPSPRRFWRAALLVLALLAVGAGGFWAKERADWSRAQSGAEGLCVACRKLRDDVAGAFNRWYAKWLSAEPPPPVVAPTSPPAPPPENFVKIRCGHCGGLGYTSDGAARSACLLCGGDGGRTFVLPAGAAICPQCGGMGKTVDVIHGREQTVLCKMCAGKGFVVRKY